VSQLVDIFSSKSFLRVISIIVSLYHVQFQLLIKHWMVEMGIGPPSMEISRKMIQVCVTTHFKIFDVTSTSKH